MLLVACHALPLCGTASGGASLCSPCGACWGRWYQEIVAATDDIAAIMTAECGKPISESKAEIAAG